MIATTTLDARRSIDGVCALVSVVVPCYDEADALGLTHSRLTEALEAIPDIRYEIIYVDDGSRDATAEIARGFCAADPRVRLVRFSRNFGHQTAVTAGIDFATGDALVVIDADLQDPPEVIHEFVERWREGFDVAYGARLRRLGETRFRLWITHWFYRLMRRMSDVDIPLDTGDFRLIDRRVADVLRSMPERHRYLRGMVAWAGFRQTAVGYRRDPRVAGESKYPYRQLLRLALEGITSFSVFPLRMVTWLGFLVSLGALAGVVYAFAVRLLTRDWPAGWASLFVAILFLGGVQLIALGMIGAYIGRIYDEAKGRPRYVVEEVLAVAGNNGERPANGVRHGL